MTQEEARAFRTARGREAREKQAAFLGSKMGTCAVKLVKFNG
jgi:hypothetical protein